MNLKGSEKEPGNTDSKLSNYDSKSEDLKSASCAESFKGRFNLRIHKKYNCEECPSVFGQKVHLEIHSRRKHSKSSDENNDMPVDTSKPLDHLPHRCEKSFTQKCSLHRHVETVHENLKKHKCTNCTAAFTEKRVLMKHIEREHQNSKPPETQINDQSQNRTKEVFEKVSSEIISEAKDPDVGHSENSKTVSLSSKVIDPITHSEDENLGIRMQKILSINVDFVRKHSVKDLMCKNM